MATFRSNYSKNKKSEEEIYFFASFDLQNSTALKNSKAGCDSWVKIFSSFYELLTALVTKDLNLSTWKYIGDEVLFFCKFSTLGESFSSLLENLFKVKETVKSSLISEYKIKEIDIKVSVWVVPFFKNSHRNRIVSVKYDDESTRRDFLGQDMDIGFRLAKYSNPNAIVMSISCASLFMDCNKEIVEKFKIVGVKKLKGVNNDAFYPVIWYSPNWKKLEVESSDEFVSKAYFGIAGGIDKLSHIIGLLKLKNDIEKLKNLKNHLRLQKNIELLDRNDDKVNDNRLQ